MLKRGLFLVVLLSIFFISQGSAQEFAFNHVISNAEDWREVYSIMHYGSLKNAGKDFLVSPRHGPILLNGINNEKDLLIVSSRDLPFSFNYEAVARGAGFENVEEIVVDNANLELIDDLPEVRNFVIVGDTYGYNAIAAVPYAVSKNSWVFFANQINIDDIVFILENRDVDEVLIYGFVPREVRDALAPFNPDIIDSGDRFEDNVEIVKRLSGDGGPPQILLTNGEFIESELMSGSYPILFTGKENVPDVIASFIQSSDIEVGVLIGADLVGAATNIRRSAGISVIVKFARGARNPTGAIAAVEGLDLFYLPIPILELTLHSAKYNRATEQLEVTYRSDSNVPVFLKGTLTPITEGTERTRIGDVDPIFIAPDDFKTISYDDVPYTGGEMQLEVFTLFGDTPLSLEKILEGIVDVEIVNVLDGCDIDIVDVVYHKPRESFGIKIENVGTVNCFVDVELLNIIIDGTETPLGAEGSIEVGIGDTEWIYVEQQMTDEDLADNQIVEVIAYYGERADSLVKALRGKYDLRIISISFATIGLIALIVLVLIALIFLLFVFLRRRREDFEDDF